MSQKLLISLLCICCALSTKAQNLIYNGSFEKGLCDIDTINNVNNYNAYVLNKETGWAPSVYGDDNFCGACMVPNTAFQVSRLYLYPTTKYKCCPGRCIYGRTYPLSDSVVISYNLLNFGLNSKGEPSLVNYGYLQQKLPQNLIINHHYYLYFFRNFTMFSLNPDPFPFAPWLAGKKVYFNPLTEMGDTNLRSLEGISMNTTHDAFGFAVSSTPFNENKGGWNYTPDSIIATQPIQRKLRFTLEYDTIWKKIDGEFVADSAYEYVMFGNLWKTSEINFSRAIDRNTSMPERFFMDSVNLWDVTLNIRGDTIFCENDSTKLYSEHFSRGYTIWYDKNKDSIYTGDTLRTYFLQSQFVYAKRVFPEIDYESFDSVFVQMATVKGKYTLQQVNDTCTLPAIFEALPADLTYYWNKVPKSNRDTFYSDGLMELIVVDTNQCKDTALFTVKPEFSISLTRIGDTCSLPAILEVLPTNASYTWNGNIGNHRDTIRQSGNVVIIGNMGKCADTITQYINPEISFTITMESDSCVKPAQIRLSNDSLLYQFNNQDISSSFTLREQGKLTVVGRWNDCEKAVQFYIPVCDLTPIYYMPTSFSPNKDGINDVFQPWTIYLKTYQMQVFNRWGEKVYESIDDNTGWDGLVQGKNAPTGQYIYLVELTFINGQKVNLKGTVTLVR